MNELPFPYQKNKLLRDVSTFRIGGPARFFAQAETQDKIQEMLMFASLHGIPFLIIGKGSNCVFDDAGFDGLVIQNKINTITVDENHYCVGSGYSFARLGHQTTQAGWTGLEFAAGIPATVGGAIFMNAGANGQETADCLKEVSYIDEKGIYLRWQQKDLSFGYRKSLFQAMRGSIIAAKFSLKPSPHAKQHKKKLLDYRLKTQPYQDHSAGCAFRNPLGHSAGQLIDACGLKGMRIGGAQVSHLHANFIVNVQDATSADVKELMRRVQEIVFAKKAIYLEEEIRFFNPYG